MFGFFKSYTPQQKVLRNYFRSQFSVRPRNISFYEEALRHKSIAGENKLRNNERLEFLGDAVIDSVVARYLFENHRKASEGTLTQMKARIVSRQSLGKLGKAIALDQYVEFVDGPYVNKLTICGNAFEAVIGAIYLDMGYKAAKASLLHVFSQHTDLNKLVHENKDYKSQLLIWSQKNKFELEFSLISDIDKGFEHEYTIQVLIDSEIKGSGTAGSKKKAEQLAAKEALVKIQGT